jgi:hypothetical protein
MSVDVSVPTSFSQSNYKYNNLLSITSYVGSDKNKQSFTYTSWFLNRKEDIFNELGHMLLISNLSAVGRFCFGSSLIICGLAIAAFRLLEAFFYDSNSINDARSAALYSLHGAANIFRALVESLPGAGNIACVAYDYFSFKLVY